MTEASAHSPDTKTQLLDAAETLFEQNGIRGTSLRAITERAGANIASVNYHFGSKEELVRAVIARRVDPLNEERIRRLDALEAQPDYDLEDVLTALIEPALRNPDLYPGLRLLARLHFEPTQEFHRLVHEPFSEIQRRFFAAIRKTAPQPTDTSLLWRLWFGVGAMAGTIVNMQHLQAATFLAPNQLPHGAKEVAAMAGDTGLVTRQLVRFIAGGMAMPDVDPASASGDPES